MVVYNRVLCSAGADNLKRRVIVRTLGIVALVLLAVCCCVEATVASDWTSVAPMLTARDEFTGGVINGKIYVFGGNGDPDGFNLKSTEVYDPATNQWSYVASNEHAGGYGVEEVSGAVINDKLYVFGGYGSPQGVYGDKGYALDGTYPNTLWFRVRPSLTPLIRPTYVTGSTKTAC
jgi:N-acetylneuraminic acid mutarotase